MPPAPPFNTRPCPPLLALGLATRAHLLGEQAQWPLAEQALQALVAFQPLHAVHWFNLGYVQEQMGQFQAAQQAFERALVLSPRLDAAWLGLGAALAQQGLCSQAAAAWTHHAQRQPLCPDPLVRLVRLHVAQGDWPAAACCLDQLRNFDPRQAMALEAWVASLGASGTSDGGDPGDAGNPSDPRDHRRVHGGVSAAVSCGMPGAAA